MIDFILESCINNAFLALLLALLAVFSNQKLRRPHLAHTLWVLVLIKLLTPPLVGIPAINLPSLSTATPSPHVVHRYQVPASWEFVDLSVANNAIHNDLVWEDRLIESWSQAVPWLGFVWLSGTGLMIITSVIRIAKFHHLLRESCQVAPTHVQRIARSIGRRMELRTAPTIFTTSARISPMVWWLGREIQVILPAHILHDLSAGQWRCVLAHELAHVKRRDYALRWLEWLACACLWWNPVTWWAQRNLRATEEICCDALVLSSDTPGAHRYAESILVAVESLVCPVVRPPVMACEVNSGGFLERRIEMILSGNTQQNGWRPHHWSIVAAAVFLVPLGLVQAQDFDAVEKRLAKSVKKGEISLQHAAVMMEALKESADDQHAHGDDDDHMHDEDRDHGEHLHVDHDDDDHVEHGRKALRYYDYAKGDDDAKADKKTFRWYYRQPEAKDGDQSSKSKRTWWGYQSEEQAEAVEKAKEAEADKKRAVFWIHELEEKEAADFDRAKRKYATAEAQFEKLVAAGELEREAAQKKLIALRKALEESQRAKAAVEKQAKSFRIEGLGRAETLRTLRDQKDKLQKAAAAQKRTLRSTRVSPAESAKQSVKLAELTLMRREADERAKQLASVQAQLESLVKAGKSAAPEVTKRVERLKQELYEQRVKQERALKKAKERLVEVWSSHDLTDAPEGQHHDHDDHGHDDKAEHRHAGDDHDHDH